MTTQSIKTQGPASGTRRSAIIEFAAGVGAAALICALVLLIVALNAAPENVGAWFFGAPLLMLIAALWAMSQRRWRFIAGQFAAYVVNIFLAAYIGSTVCPVGVIRAGYYAFFGIPFSTFIGFDPYALCF